MKFQIPSFSETRIPIIVRALVNGLTGRSLAIGTVTLTPSATTTVVNAEWVGPTDTILLSPQTANAAGALATTYISAVGQGTFTLTHSSAVSVDRTFDWHSAGG